MVNTVFKNIIRFVLLVLIQALIIKNFELGRFMNPFIYVLYILILPFETPKWLLLISAFLLGISVDLFYDTAGMHAAASVWMAYVRPGVLRLFAPREGYENSTQPTIQYFGVPWFLSYAGTLILLHHALLFYIEIFRFNEFFSTLFRVIVSAGGSLLLVVVSQFLFHRNKNNT